MSAVVTGASSGIGEAYARALADRGLPVVVHGRRRERLEALAADLGGGSWVMEADLADEIEVGGACEVIGRMDDLEWLVLNAGFGGGGVPLGEQSPELSIAMIRVHDEATVRLARAALPALRENRGTLVIVSSIAAFAPFPGSAVYGASKAFLLIFAQALHLEEERVRVQALCPGLTRTDFHRRLGLDPDKVYKDSGFWRAQSSEEVVAASLRDLERGRVVCVPGANNQLMDLAARWLPRSLLHGRLQTLARRRKEDRGR